MNLKRAALLILVPISLLGIGLIAIPVVALMGGNIHEVDRGHFYRSAQLSGPMLESYLDRVSVHSILNLRGPHKEDPAYRSEVRSCQSRGIEHQDITLSASGFPEPEQLQKLLRALDQMPQPVLVHCSSGADRSGLVSTLYLNVYRGVELPEAERQQLTWRYSHLNWFGAGTMDRFFDLYRSTSDGAPLRTWILDTYPAVYRSLSHRNSPGRQWP